MREGGGELPGGVGEGVTVIGKGRVEGRVKGDCDGKGWRVTLTAGGARSASLMARRKERSESQVSRSMVEDCWASSWAEV